MTWINRLEPNMDISLNVLEGQWENAYITTAQKIATYTLIPFLMIAFLEGVIKNLIFINLANGVITILNGVKERFDARFGN